jgi:putative protease
MMKVHASTQMGLNSYYNVIWAKNNGISRVIFPREIGVDEIYRIHSRLKENNSDLELEVFAHGAICYSISGRCYFSSLNNGRSGNRGACSQPCRKEYILKYNGRRIDSGYLLSTHDLNVSDDLDKILKACIDSIKLEGRMKSEDYVGTIVNSYRNLLDNKGDHFKDDLNMVFNRKFTKGYLLGEKPRDVIGRESSGHVGFYIGDIIDIGNEKTDINENVYQVKEVNLDKKNKIDVKIGDGIAFKYKDKIKGIYLDNIVEQNDECVVFNTTRNVRVGDKAFISYSHSIHRELKKYKNEHIQSKLPISLNISICENLQIFVKSKFVLNDVKLEFNYLSSFYFEKAINQPISIEKIERQLSKTGNTPFFMDKIEITNFHDDLFIAISELNNLRRKILDEAIKTLLKYYKPNKKQISSVKSKLNSFIKNYKSEKLDDFKENKLCLSVFVDNLKLIKVASSYPLRKIYFDPSYLYDNSNDYFKNIENLLLKALIMLSMDNTLKKSVIELIWVLPSFILDDEVDKCVEILNNLKNEGFDLSIMSDVPGINNLFNCNRCCGNYSLNVWNSFACKNLKEAGFNSLILSPELSYDEIKELNLKYIKRNLNLELIVHGNLEVIVSYDDFSNLKQEKTIKFNDNSDYLILEDKKRKKFKYTIHFDFNKKSHIMNKDCLCLIDELDKIKDLKISSIILDCRFSSESYTSRIISLYLKGLKNTDKKTLNLLKKEVYSISHSYLSKGNFLKGRAHEKINE